MDSASFHQVILSKKPGSVRQCCGGLSRNHAV